MDGRKSTHEESPATAPDARPTTPEPAHDGGEDREGVAPATAVREAQGNPVVDAPSDDSRRRGLGGLPDPETDRPSGDPPWPDHSHAEGVGHGEGPSSGAWRPSAAQAWRRIRDVRPSVVLVGTLPEGVADALAALGARPMRAAVPDEAPGLYAACGAVVVDAGATLSGRWGHGVGSARARSGAPPLLLIATLVDRSPLRCNEARRFVAEARPSVIRGTVAELSALVGLEEAPGTGHAAAASVAQVVAHRTGAVAVAWTDGEVASADPRTMRSAPQSGTPAQVRIAAHAIDAAIAANLACGADPLAGVRASITIVESAVQAASRHGHGPGTFATTLLDTLAGAGEDDAPASAAEPADDPRTLMAVVSHGSAVAHADDPDVPHATFPSMVDAVANRFEGGRVVPGSVPVHLLRHAPDARAGHSVHHWTQVVSIEVRTVPHTEVHDGSAPDDPIARAMLGAINAGATAVLLDVAGMNDANALTAIRRAGAAAEARSIAVAVRGRVDLAIAGGADGVWIDPRAGSIPVGAAVAVASGRVIVIAGVESETEARDAIGAGASVIAAHDVEAFDLAAFAAEAGVAMGAFLSLPDTAESATTTPESPVHDDSVETTPQDRRPEGEGRAAGESDA